MARRRDKELPPEETVLSQAEVFAEVDVIKLRQLAAL